MLTLYMLHPGDADVGMAAMEMRLTLPAPPTDKDRKEAEEAGAAAFEQYWGECPESWYWADECPYCGANKNTALEPGQPCTKCAAAMRGGTGGI